MNNTPKHFALQLGALITLYVSISALIAVLFGIITVSFPDAAGSSWQYRTATESIRFGIAMLVVFFPAYVWLTRSVNQIRRSETGAYLTLTKWLIYLSLLVGGIVLLGTAVSVIYGFLNGELTTRFFLKAAVLAVVIKAAFYYYYQDAKGYWQTHEKQSIYIGAVMTVVVLGAIGLGVHHLETPSEVREAAIDERQVDDLRTIQWAIEEQYRTEEALPDSLESLYAPAKPPTAPEGRESYQYSITSESEYSLCATFAQSSNDQNEFRSFPAEKNYNWYHEAGEWCFERKIVEPVQS